MLDLTRERIGSAPIESARSRVWHGSLSRVGRTRLLRLVYVASLALVLSLGGGLAIITSAHVSSAAIATGAAADRALVDALLVDLGPAAIDSDVRASVSEAAVALLGRAVRTAGLEWVGVRSPSGAIRLQSGEPPLDLTIAATDISEAGAVLVDGPHGPLMVETFPASVDGGLAAVVQIVRDGTPVLAAVDSARRDILVGTGIGAVVLIAVLFLIFRGAQKRLDQQTDQLLESGRRDALTGVLNHGAAISALADALGGAVEHPVAIGLVDIDNFRRVNDVHGHGLGDRALRTVASILNEGAGSADVVGRSGPDEFVVIAPGLDGRELLARLASATSRMSRVVLDAEDGSRLPLTVSVAVAVAPLHGRTSTELLAAAAMTLGEVKAAGGDAMEISRLSYAELAQERRGTFAVLDGLIQAIDTRDRYTRRHSEDVARYALFLGRQLGVDGELLSALHHSALLHDIGKISMPDDILRKPGALTADEVEIMQQHVVLGSALVRDLDNGELIADGVRHHHERWDGSGYISSLAGEEIPLIARIIAVADAFSAMTTSRPYRHALDPGEALRRLVRAAGSQLDPRLVDVFVLAMESQQDRPLTADERPPTYWLKVEAAA